VIDPDEIRVELAHRSGSSDPIRLPTRDGAIEVRPGSGSCTGCRTKGGGLLELTVRGAVEGDRDAAGAIDLCGNCLAEGLAILLGRRHVQAGGSIEDLRVPPPT
jgi:hypothetical protein